MRNYRLTECVIPAKTYLICFCIPCLAKCLFKHNRITNAMTGKTLQLFPLLAKQEFINRNKGS